MEILLKVNEKIKISIHEFCLNTLKILKSSDYNIKTLKDHFYFPFEYLNKSLFNTVEKQSSRNNFRFLFTNRYKI